MFGPGFLDLPDRPGKPRRTGITHVLDRGLPLAQAWFVRRFGPDVNLPGVRARGLTT